MDYKQIKRLIEKVLEWYNLKSDSAVNLLLGTMAAESDFGKYIRQNVKDFDIKKHALGFFQMERTTFEWLKAVYSARYDLDLLKFHELECDLSLMILFARLRYLVVPEPLPDANDIQGLAEYWKKYYNTYEGKGTVEHFIKKYNKFCK